MVLALPLRCRHLPVKLRLRPSHVPKVLRQAALRHRLVSTHTVERLLPRVLTDVGRDVALGLAGEGAVLRRTRPASS